MFAGGTTTVVVVVEDVEVVVEVVVVVGDVVVGEDVVGDGGHRFGPFDVGMWSGRRACEGSVTQGSGR
jgi:hypothetical protein